MSAENETLSAWVAKWVLVDGQIACVKCGRRQSVKDAEEEFVHASGCEADVHPWTILHDALDRERG